jgi:CheY-like chemotaxis protein
VDDQEISRYLFKQVFRSPSVRFVEATDGSQSLSAARANSPDLIVMDLSMPEMNGFDAIDLLKADAALQNIPIVVATSKSLTPGETERLKGKVLTVLAKDSLLQASSGAKLRKVLASVGLEDLFLEEEIGLKEGNV